MSISRPILNKSNPMSIGAQRVRPFPFWTVSPNYLCIRRTPSPVHIISDRSQACSSHNGKPRTGYSKCALLTKKERAGLSVTPRVEKREGTRAISYGCMFRILLFQYIRQNLIFMPRCFNSCHLIIILTPKTDNWCT